MLEIDRGTLSLQEVKGYVKDHMELKESMKFYFFDSWARYGEWFGGS